MQIVRQPITTKELLVDAARATQRAAKACRRWERGGCPDAVGDTADAALIAADTALEAAQTEDEGVLQEFDPGTRRARLVLAAHMLLLAGTDEQGQSDDLTLAAKTFRLAAEA